MTLPLSLSDAKRLSFWLLGLGIPLVAMCYAVFDPVISRAVATLGQDGVVRLAEIYTNLGDPGFWHRASFVLLIFAIVLESLRGPTLPGRTALFLCLSLLAAMLVGGEMKTFFARCRPELLLTKGEYGFTWTGKGDLHHSFPSGHSYCSFAVATSMGLRFPRLGPVLLLAAALVAVSRVLVLRHYPGDVLTGAMVGLLSAVWVDVLLRRAWEETGQ